MVVPYVIDNESYRLADVLNSLLAQHRGRSVDVATAYFTIGGFQLLKDGLLGLGNLRLLLGAEPRTGEHIGLRPNTQAIILAMRRDLEFAPFDEATLRLVEDLIAFLGRNGVAVRLYERGFLHAKCYLFYNDHPTAGWDRFQPVVGIVGSSNLTGPGLTSNRELNLSHKAVLSDEEVLDDLTTPPWPISETAREQAAAYGLEARRQIKSSVGARAIAELDRWFEERWQEARDFKADLIELLNASKFGTKEYTPYQVYMKALFEYFRDELEAAPLQATRSAVDLAEFQEDAVKKARKILARYDGVMIADSVGLGKTWIGKKLLEDFAYHLRQQAVVVCPASLREMWEQELANATVPAMILSQEEMGRGEFDPVPYADADVLLIDESHNFRNRTAQRYSNLERLLILQGGRGRAGGRKKVILITATPINNDLFDLYNQLGLITQGDRSYFAAAGIGDLYRYFLAARRDAKQNGGTLALFNLLEEVAIRRTRAFIRKAYPEATIRGEKVTFPDRKLRTVRYNLERTYADIYDEFVAGVESLRLAPYNLESYKKAGVAIDELEAGREQALVGIFKSRYLKRFESSVEAFRISVRRALQFATTFESYFLGGKVMRSRVFQRALRALDREDEEDDATPASIAEQLDADESTRWILAEMEEVEPTQYDLRRLHEALQHDIEVLTRIWDRVKDIGPQQDAKLARLAELLGTELRGKKVLIFSYYRDTARYVHRQLTGPYGESLRGQLGDVTIRRMDSGTHSPDRARIIQGFAPVANGRSEWGGTEHEIDILISTDVLSEGQNLQDCGHLVNYDLHWNPTRMVQRAGRIDRIGTPFGTLWIYNMFPERRLEELLGIVQRLEERAEQIDTTGLLDAPIFEGQTVTPRNFNALRRIRDEDGAVIEEEEQFSELATGEFLLQQLRSLLDVGGREMLEALPDGIHSGLVKPRAKGVFFYFQAPVPDGDRYHFWRYYDLNEKRVLDNRLIIADRIRCEPNTPRVMAEVDTFAIQERVIEDILRSFQQQEALKVAPRALDPLQQTVATVLQGFLSHPGVERPRVVDMLRFLGAPMPAVQVKELRRIFKEFQASGDVEMLVEALEHTHKVYGGGGTGPGSPSLDVRSLAREDLRLICFNVVSS